MGRLIRQTHLVVLALDFDQKSRDATQQPNANGLIVHIGPRPRIGGNRAPEHKRFMRVIKGNTLFGKKLMDRVTIGNIETGGNASLICPGTDQPAAGAVSQSQSKGVEKDGLARPGFTRKDRQSRMKRQIEPLDQNDIAYREVSQHARRS